MKVPLDIISTNERLVHAKQGVVQSCLCIIFINKREPPSCSKLQEAILHKFRTGYQNISWLKLTHIWDSCLSCPIKVQKEGMPVYSFNKMSASRLRTYLRG